MPACSRFLTLDAMRGFAVMGILLMNIIAFSMPGMAYINPRLWGGETPIDYAMRSEEHTSELQSLMRISYAVFCLKKKKKPTNTTNKPVQINTYQETNQTH